MLKKSIGQLKFDFSENNVTIDNVMTPKGYAGLSAFHKYWGKKPTECLGFLIEKLTNPNDLVIDPFVGSGLIARECTLRSRRFIGIDINPISVELARMISDLPDLNQFMTAMLTIERTVKPLIDESYLLVDGKTASHYLWDKTTLKSVWISKRGKGGREVREPGPHDHKQFANFMDYKSKAIRPLQFFKNSRINTEPELSLSDIFTGRALRNIDLIIQNMPSVPLNIRRALLLTLTASIGQMSNMVFAITGRGKTTNTSTGKIEVGSWVIGYWRPPVHFEINVWNCFERRANKLVAALSDLGQPSATKLSASADAVTSGSANIALLNDNALRILRTLPSESTTLVLTDPPHGDRIPYLELSELWNAIIGKSADFQEEIVVSNARERGKTKAQYNENMADLLIEIERVLKPGGTLALLFNARDTASWKGLVRKGSGYTLQYYGCFPMTYSANSVVQDNRTGALKSDYVLIYRKPGKGKEIRDESLINQIHGISGWSKQFPSTKEI